MGDSEPSHRATSEGMEPGEDILTDVVVGDAVDNATAEIVGAAGGEGLTATTVRGASWSAAYQLLGQPITILTGIVLARILSPAEFGLMGMAGIALGLIALVNELGLAAAIIQKQSLDELELSSLYWLNLAVGVGFTLVGIVLSFPMATFFNEPLLVPLMSTLSIGFTLSSISSVQRALLVRRMEFRALGAYGFIGVVLSSTIAVGLALAGAGVWSLVASGLIAQLVPVALTWRKARWAPRRVFSWTACAQLVHFGAYVTVSGILYYGVSNIDYAAIGRVLGKESLGVYTLAFNLMTFPLRRLSEIFAGVSYPAFTRIQDDKPRFAAAYMKVVRLAAVSAIPLLSVVIVVAPQLVLGLYGAKWSGAIVPLQILSIVGMIKATGTFVGIPLRGFGHPEIEAYWNAAYLALMVPAVLVGLRWGIVGVSAGVALATLPVAVGQHGSALRLMNARFSALGAAMLPGVVLGVAAAIGAYAATRVFGGLPALAIVALGFAFGLGLAVGVGLTVWRTVVLEICDIAASSLPERVKRLIRFRRPEDRGEEQ